MQNRFKGLATAFVKINISRKLYAQQTPHLVVGVRCATHVKTRACMQTPQQPAGLNSSTRQEL